MRLRFNMISTLVLVSALSASNASAWDEDGHAIITYLACDSLPDAMPDWIKSREVRERLVYLSSEPDRWRGQHNIHLDHINNPDHYLDEEKLHPYGLSLKNLPELRTEFTDILATKRTLYPEKFDKRRAARDKDYTQLSPGLLPYRISELMWKVSAGWTQLKTYEKHRDRVSESMIRNARENIVYHMGILSHFVGDGSQPLHLTHHHHGWVGPNSKGYTTDKAFHALIDDGIILSHHIHYDGLTKRIQPPRKISTDRYWKDVCEYLYESYELVEPLYELEKNGRLKQAEGKTFIESRLLAAGSALAGIWNAAYEGAGIDNFRVNRLLQRYPKKPGRAPKIERKPVVKQSH